MRRGVPSRQDGWVIPALLPHGDLVAHLDHERRDIDFACVDLDVAVPHDLARLRPAGAEAHAIDHIVEAALQVRQHDVAGDAFGQGGLFEIVAKLGFEQAIDAARLLLLAQLQTAAYQLGLAVFAMLAGDKVALLDGALLRMAALPLQEQLHALAPAQPAYGANISSQANLLNYTLLFFGGRHPLCGIGV